MPRVRDGAAVDRKQIVLMHRDGEDGRVVIEHGLRAIAMVYVPIHHGHALHFALSLQAAYGDGRVAK